MVKNSAGEGATAVHDDALHRFLSTHTPCVCPVLMAHLRRDANPSEAYPSTKGAIRVSEFPDSLTALRIDIRIPACVSGNRQINLDALLEPALEP